MCLALCVGGVMLCTHSGNEGGESKVATKTESGAGAARNGNTGTAEAKQGIHHATSPMFISARVACCFIFSLEDRDRPTKMDTPFNRRMMALFSSARGAPTAQPKTQN